MPTKESAATISVTEAAAKLGVSRNLAYLLAARGELPGAIRLGRRILVSRAALDRALGVDGSAPS